MHYQGFRRVPILQGLFVIILILTTFVGCDSDSDEVRLGDADDNLGDDDTDNDDDDVDCDNPYTICDLGTDIGGDWSCAAQGDRQGCSCVDDYLNFPELDVEQIQNHRDPLPGGIEELYELIDLIASGAVDPVQTALDPNVLKNIILSEINASFMIDGINDRRLYVTIIDEHVEDGYIEQELLFNDEWIGEFKAVFAFPTDVESYPVVIARHGHGESARDFYDRRNYYQLPLAGYAVIIPYSRAFCGNLTDEHLVTETLLVEGFTFQGLRYLETRLMLKYLQYLDWRYGAVDSDRLGIFSHSGGCASVNLTVRIDDFFGAAVVDWFDNYCSLSPPLLDSTVPSLWPYGSLVNDLSTVEIPVLKRDYSFLDPQTLIEFFNDNLY
ncbi:MAG: hypothetical protein P9M14_02830 [Candidatus Alcyoniella australis]|nr:hypothetical protein [Candidatus Alcyoniella australis]